MKGKIVRIISNLYTVQVNNKLYNCHARGKFRNDKLTPLVGDECLIDSDNLYILELLPRKNELNRPNLANIDMGVVITSCKDPELSLNLLDKMLCNIIGHDIEPLICFTKVDLLNKDELKYLKKIKKYYHSIGIKVVLSKNKRKLMRMLKNKTVVFTGQTGAGKSTLLNRLDKQLNLATQEISTALGRGKHTTRHVELYKIGKCLIADTPGFSALDFKGMKMADLQATFNEFKKYQCAYKNCSHVDEVDCEIKKAVGRKDILLSRYEKLCQVFKGCGKMKVAVSFLKRIKSLEETLEGILKTDADYIHVDVVDGIFASPKNYDPKDLMFLEDIKKDLDVHLMCQNPEDYYESLVKINAKRVTIQGELDNLDKRIDLFKNSGFLVGLAIKPETDIKIIIDYLDRIDNVLVLSVTPGQGGQVFNKDIISKILKLNNLKSNYNYEIQVDGGINDTTIGFIKNQVDCVVSGFYIINSDNYQERIDSLRI